MEGLVLGGPPHSSNVIASNWAPSSLSVSAQFVH